MNTSKETRVNALVFFFIYFFFKIVLTIYSEPCIVVLVRQREVRNMRDKLMDLLAGAVVFIIIMALLFGFESMGLMLLEVFKKVVDSL